MADIDFVQGDNGDNYDFPVYEKGSGKQADLTGYTGGTMKIMSTDETTTIQSGISISVAQANPGIARWAMASGQTNYFGDYIAQVTFTGPGKQKATFIATVHAEKLL